MEKNTDWGKFLNDGNPSLDDFGTHTEEIDLFAIEPANYEVAGETPSGANLKKKKGNKKSDKKNSNLEGAVGRFVQFAEFGQGFTISGRTHKKLEAGVYDIDFFEGSPIYTPKNIKSDKWINFRDGFVKEILDEIDRFWEKRKMFEKYEILQRRGFMFYGPAGTGKAQPLYSKILTPDGWTLMRHVKVGDKVYSKDGKITSITGVFPQGIKKIYTINFSDGVSVDCCEDHLWEVQTPDQKHSISPNSKILDTKEILDYCSIHKKKLYIPLNNNPIIFNKKEELLIDPYILGVLIGDGGLQRAVTFNTADIEIFNYVKDRLIDGYTLSSSKDRNHRVYRIVKNKRNRYIKNIYFEELKNLYLNVKSKDKYIPSKYLFSSVEERIELLQGLFDTDGTVCKKNNTAIYSSTSKILIEGIIHLVNSLGGITSKIRKKESKYKDKNGNYIICNPSYSIVISFNNNICPFKLKRKKELYKEKNHYKNIRMIESVVYKEENECQCISVEDESHLYMTDGFVLTHNTIICKQIMSKIIDNDGIVFYCSHPGFLAKGISYYRQVEPDRKLTVVFEDIDAIIQKFGDTDLLSYLDGEDSNNYIVNIATTNYPEKLDRRIISRPRRFDRVIKIGFPDRNMREFYFKQKLYIKDAELEKWVDATDNFTFAGLTELVISVKCLDIPFDEAVKKIGELMDNKPHSDEFRTRQMGFGGR